MDARRVYASQAHRAGSGRGGKTETQAHTWVSSANRESARNGAHTCAPVRIFTVI